MGPGVYLLWPFWATKMTREEGLVASMPCRAFRAKGADSSLRKPPQAKNIGESGSSRIFVRKCFIFWSLGPKKKTPSIRVLGARLDRSHFGDTLSVVNWYWETVQCHPSRFHHTCKHRPLVLPFIISPFRGFPLAYPYIFPFGFFPFTF